MLGFSSLMFYALISASLCAIVGRCRFYIYQTNRGREFLRRRYGVWVEKLASGLVTAGFVILMIRSQLNSLIGWLARITDDRDGSKSCFAAVIIITALVALYYNIMLHLARHSERVALRDRHFRKFFIFCRRSHGKKIASLSALLAGMRKTEKKMSRYSAPKEDRRIDVIDPALRAPLTRSERKAPHHVAGTMELTRAKRVAPRPIAVPRYHSDGQLERVPVSQDGWEIIQRKSCNPQLAIAPALPLNAEASTSQPATLQPQVNEASALKRLEQQLSPLPEADRKLVLEYFQKHSDMLTACESRKHRISASIIPATEDEPRHVRVRLSSYKDA